MAKIIELCGSPGVGKSTIYKEIVSKWRRYYNWTPAHYLYPQVNSDYRSIKNFLITFLKKDYRKTDAIAMRNAGRRFVSQYPQFIEACWNHILLREKESLNGTDQRFEKAVYMYTLMQKIQISRESEYEKIAIVEEGLINGIGNVLFKSENIIEEKEEIIDLLNQMPLPNALVYVETDINENIRRLVTRKKVLSSLKSLDTNQLSNITQKLRKTREMATKVLEDIGIPVLYINSTDSVGINASKIISFAEVLNTKLS